MPNLAVPQTQSLVPQESVAVGNGGPGDSQIVGGALAMAGDAAHIYQQHQDEQARIWAGSAASNLHVQQLQAIQQAKSDATDAIANGQPVPDMTGDFLTSFDNAASGVINSAPNGVSKRYLENTLNETRMRLGDQMVQQQAILTRQWKLSTADDTMQNGAKIVQQDPTQYDAQMGNIMTTMPHIDPETDALHATKARATLANAAADTVLATDPYTLRDLTNHAMGVGGATGPTGAGYVDGASTQEVATWNKLANAKINQIENANRLDADARERNAQMTFNTLQGFVAQGSVPDLGYIARVRSDTAGTSFEESANQAINISTRGAGFGSASLPAQQARIEQMQGAAGDGTNPEDAALATQLQQIHTTQVAAYKDDPLDAAARFTHAPPMPTQQITSVAQGLQLVGQRAPGLPAVESAAGAAVSPLHPAEAQQLGELLKQLPPDQAASALSSIGSTIGNSDRIAALGKQLKDQNGTMGLAMAYAGNRTDSGRLVGELILRGEQALGDKTSEQDKSQQTGWQATIAKDIRGVYSSQETENDAVRAAYLIAAGRASMSGDTNIDTAVSLATGGIIQHGTAGAKIPLPYGMAQDDFEKKLAAVTPQALSDQVPDGVVHVGSATLPLAQFVTSLPNATLVHAGQGLYNVRGGTQLATNAQGQRITIKVGP